SDVCSSDLAGGVACGPRERSQRCGWISMTSACPPIAPGPITRRPRPAGVPTWAARAYNRADAHKSSLVFVDLKLWPSQRKTSGKRGYGFDLGISETGEMMVSLFIPS